LEKKGASSISVCTFLDKPARRKVNVHLVGDGKFYRGFEVPVRVPPLSLSLYPSLPPPLWYWHALQNISTKCYIVK
jgi:hypothetical protein